MLSVINLNELVKLKICVRLGDTWAWVASGPERQLIAAAGALEDRAIKDDQIRGGGGAWGCERHWASRERSGVRYMSYSDSRIPYQRRTRRRTDGASTSASPQQPDP
ncbi:hypothetical protein Tco_0492661 [Tanacetum coccineum]